MHQFTAHTVTHSSTTDDQTSNSNLAISDSPTETDTESSASTSDSEKSYADITNLGSCGALGGGLKVILTVPSCRLSNILSDV